MIMCSQKILNQTVCFGHDNLDLCLSPKVCFYKDCWTMSTSLISGSESHYTLLPGSGSSVLRLKWPPSPNKDASLLKAPHSTMNLVTPPHLPPPLPPSLPLQSVLPAPTVCLWKWSVPERWAEPLHVHIGPRGIPACPLLLLSFVSQMDTN